MKPACFLLLSLKNESVLLFKTQQRAATAPEHRVTPGLAQPETMNDLQTVLEMLAEDHP